MCKRVSFELASPRSLLVTSVSTRIIAVAIGAASLTGCSVSHLFGKPKNLVPRQADGSVQIRSGVLDNEMTIPAHVVGNYKAVQHVVESPSSETVWFWQASDAPSDGDPAIRLHRMPEKAATGAEIVERVRARAVAATFLTKEIEADAVTLHWTSWHEGRKVESFARYRRVEGSEWAVCKGSTIALASEVCAML